MKLPFLILFLLLSLDVFSNETHCFCEVGENPTYQIPFFKMGCQLWLNRQSNCSSKRIVNRSELSSGNLVSAKNSNIDFNIGYVGHWSKYNDTLNYLYNVISPLSRKFKANIKLDLTGCSGVAKEDYFFNNPQYNWILKLPPGIKIDIKANQVSSVGVWTHVGAPYSYNLPVKVEVPSGKKMYPLCSSFIGNSCVHKIHKDDIGICENVNAEKIEITCCEKKWLSIWASTSECHRSKRVQANESSSDSNSIKYATEIKSPSLK